MFNGKPKDIKKKKKRATNKRTSSRFNKKNNIIKKITEERIVFLMEKAIEIYPDDSDLANRYVDICRKYSMAAKIRIPHKYKKNICHKCKKLMILGISSSSSIEPIGKNGSIKQVTCLNCGKTSKFYIKNENN